MAIYEYVITEGTCDECPGRFEAMQRMSDPALTECPKCHKPARRLISRVAIHLPLTKSKLKETGMTRLVRRDHGVYEVEGADSGLLDMSHEMDSLDDTDDDDGVTTLDFTEEMGLGSADDSSDSSTEDELHPKQKKGKKPAQLPLYDMIHGEYCEH